MKAHYFDQDKADEDDFQLKMAIHQGYVPTTCLLAGFVVFGVVGLGHDACAGCNGPREKCKGRVKVSR